MAVMTYSEYLKEKEKLDLEVQPVYDAANAEHEECVKRADEKFAQTMQMLDAVRPTTPGEAQAVVDAKEAAEKLQAEEHDACDKKRADDIEAASLAYQKALDKLNDEAAGTLARVARRIITLDELQPAAVALQDLSWYDNQTATTRATILTVSSLEDMQQMFELDRGMFNLLLLVRAEDGELVFGSDRRKISDIISDVESSTPKIGVKLRVLETVHVQGELTGAAPDDTDSLSILGTSDIRANWYVVVPPVTVEIQVDNTPPGDVGVVLLKCAHPSATAVVPCRIKLTSGQSPVTVVLHDPKNLLGFPDAATTTVTLQQVGDVVPFEISGQKPSKAVGDAVIEARVGSVTGPVCGTQRVTVVRFTSAEMNLTPGGNFGWVNTRYDAVGTAMSFEATATIQPPGVDCSVPQLASLRVGIMQELTNTKWTWTWDRPEFDASVPKGTKARVDKSIRRTRTVDPSVAQPVNDGNRPGGYPLGDYPLYEATAGLTVPLGCVKGAAATSNDNPDMIVPETITKQVSIPSVGDVDVIWKRRAKVTRRDRFRTFCVLFDTSTNQFCALRQAVWELDLDDSRPTDQHATVTRNNKPATANPAAGGVQVNNAKKKVTTKGVGGYKTITQP